MSIRKVYLAACDVCSTTVEVPESSGARGMADHPSSWGVVQVGTGRPGVCCSPACASEWVKKCWPLQTAPAEGETR